jgi:hypothetical protein
MRVQDLLIGLIIFSLFTLLILNFGFSMYSQMDVDLDNDTASVMQTFKTTAERTQTDMFGSAIDMQNRSIGGSGISRDTSKTFADNIVAGGTNVLIIAGNSFTTLQAVLDVLTENLGIDPMITTSFFVIIVIIIVMIFASSMLRQRI